MAGASLQLARGVKKTLINRSACVLRKRHNIIVERIVKAVPITQEIKFLTSQQTGGLVLEHCHEKAGLNKVLRRNQKLVVRGEHIFVIAAMTIDKIIGLKFVKGSVTGDHFYDCL